MKKVIIRLLMLVFSCIFIFSFFKAAENLKETGESRKVNEEIRKEAVNEKALEEKEDIPLKVDFDWLKGKNSDIIAYIYSENTPISYAVCKSEDNKDYLRTLLDGSYNMAGTLFTDYRNSTDFSDPNTIIYGHNMKNDSMFGSLLNYKEEGYYEEHKTMYLMTPSINYKVVLLSSFLTDTSDPIYNIGQENVSEIMERAVEKSDFKSDEKYEEGDRLLTLSTCSYESDEARYVVIGKLVGKEISKEE